MQEPSRTTPLQETGTFALPVVERRLLYDGTKSIPRHRCEDVPETKAKNNKSLRQRGNW